MLSISNLPHDRKDDVNDADVLFIGQLAETSAARALCCVSADWIRNYERAGS